jgi:hypothetical protein
MKTNEAIQQANRRILSNLLAKIESEPITFYNVTFTDLSIFNNPIKTVMPWTKNQN